LGKYVQLNKRVAIVFGATGLVGRALVTELSDHFLYSSVVVFNRSHENYDQLRIREYVIDFSRLDEYAHLIAGDDLYICLGTTIRKAGSVAAMELIDRDLPVRIARMAVANGVSRIAVVSSLGANPRSRNYYLRIKGEMESEMQKMPFTRVVLARPSILFGPRKEFRFGEMIGKGFMKAIGLLFIGPLKKYRGIDAQCVARALIALIRSDQSDQVYDSDILQKMGRK
jgi:uncharacterized protein YbjT (DUF2867 family)